MLTQEDLTNIEGIVDRKTQEVFVRQFDASFDRKFDQAFDQAFDRKFDQAFDRKFDQAFDRKFDQAFDRKFDERFSEQADLIQQGFNDIHEEFREVHRSHRAMSSNIARILDLLGEQMGEIKAIKKRMNRWEQIYPIS